MSHHHTPERLLKWYDFKPAPVPTSISFPTSPTVTPTTIATITLQKINPDDRENLEAIIQWGVTATVTPPATPVTFNYHGVSTSNISDLS